MGEVLGRASTVEDSGLDWEDNRAYKAGNSLGRRESLQGGAAEGAIEAESSLKQSFKIKVYMHVTKSIKIIVNIDRIDALY